MYNEHLYRFYNFIHLPNIMAFRSIGDKLRFMELYVCFVLSTVNDLYSNIDDGNTVHVYQGKYCKFLFKIY